MLTETQQVKDVLIPAILDDSGLDLTDNQKAELKTEVKKGIAGITHRTIDNFRSQLLAELKKQKEDDNHDADNEAGLEEGEIAEAVTAAHESLTLSPTTPPDTAITAAATAVGVSPETAQEVIKDVLRGGIGEVISRFLYTIIAAFSGKKLSYDENKTFESDVAPALQKMGINIENKPEVPDLVMGQLKKLKIPLDLSGSFFDFIQNSAADINTIPQSFRSVFESGRTHYQSLATLNPDPNTAVRQILEFTVSTPQPAPDATLASAETPPATEVPSVAPLVYVDGEGKEQNIEATPEQITAFNDIAKTATTILGEGAVNIKTSLRDAISSSTKTDKKDKHAEALLSVSKNLIRQIRDKTYILGLAVMTVTDKEGKNISFEDTTAGINAPAETVASLSDKLKTYIPLASDQLSQRVIEEVKTKFTVPTNLPNNLLANDYTGVLNKCLLSVLGYGRASGEANAASFAEKTKDGYDTVFRDILVQAEKLNTIDAQQFSSNLFAAYKEKSPLEL